MTLPAASPADRASLAEERLAFVTVPGGRLWTAASGPEPSPTTPTVLLANGGPGCCDYVAPVAAMIDDRAHVIRFEQRGCGRSSAKGPFDLATTLSDVEAIREHYGLARWIVGGHSWGADLALAYGLAHPDRAIGLLCLAGGRVHDDRSWHRAYAERREEEVQPAYAYPPNLEVNRELNASWRSYCKRLGFLADLAALPVPARFIYGAADIRPGWPVAQVAALMPAGRYVALEGADHMLWRVGGRALRAELCDALDAWTEG